MIGDQRERHGRETTKQHRDPVLHLQAGENVVAQTGLADRRRQSRAADHPDGGRPHSGHQHRRRQRQLDAQQPLPIRHANATGRLDDRRIEVGETGNSVTQNRQHRIQGQSQQRWQKTQRGKAVTTKQVLPRRRHREQEWIEQSQQGETRHRLYDTRKPEHGPADARVTAGYDYQRQADEKSERQRCGAQQNVLAKVVRQQASGCGETLTHARLVPASKSVHAPPDGAACP